MASLITRPAHHTRIPRKRTWVNPNCLCLLLWHELASLLRPAGPLSSPKERPAARVLSNMLSIILCFLSIQPELLKDLQCAQPAPETARLSVPPATEDDIPREASAMERGNLQKEAKKPNGFADLEKGRFLSVIILRHGRGSQLAGKRSNGPENLDTSHTYAVPPPVMGTRGTPGGKENERAGSVGALWSEFQSIPSHPHHAPTKGGPGVGTRLPSPIP